MAVGNREATQTALVEDGGFTLLLPVGALTMLFDVPGLETIQATIDEAGTCKIPHTPERQIALTLSVRLPSGRTAEEVQISGCGRSYTWIPSDPVLKLTIAEPCELIAWGSASMAQVSAPVQIDPADGDQRVDIVLPWEDPAGLMLQVSKRGEAFEIVSVEGQASELLAPGEQIVRIEGESAVDLSLEDFVRLDAGPEDTLVALLVRDEAGALREVQVPRERP